MNKKFFNLPIEKRNNILKAGYKVFSAYPYKKAPMSNIADEAGISKSLLFFYFTNKKEYYLFLFQTALVCLNNIKGNEEIDKTFDFFEKMSLIMKKKFEFISKYQYIYGFISRAYYETEESVQEERNKMLNRIKNDSINEIKQNIDMNRFKNEADIVILTDIIILSAEGYIYRNIKFSISNIQKLKDEYQVLLNSLKRHYYREEYIL